jgi:hypothetical protein
MPFPDVNFEPPFAQLLPVGSAALVTLSSCRLFHSGRLPVADVVDAVGSEPDAAPDAVGARRFGCRREADAVLAVGCVRAVRAGSALFALGALRARGLRPFDRLPVGERLASLSSSCPFSRRRSSGRRLARYSLPAAASLTAGREGRSRSRPSGAIHRLGRSAELEGRAADYLAADLDLDPVRARGQRLQAEVVDVLATVDPEARV